MAFTERLAFLITARGDDAIREFGKIGKSAESNLGKVDARLAKFSGLAGSVSNTLSGPVVAGASAAAAAFTAFTASGVDKFMDLAEEVKEFQRVSGASSEDASRLIDAADFVGVSAEEAANGIFQLSQRLEKNREALTAHGVAVARSASGNTDLLGTLLNVADAYTRTEDPAQRNKLVMDAFGRSGKALIPILAKGADELKRMFDSTSDDEILTPEEQRQAEEYRQALIHLEEAVGNLQLAIGQEAVPALTDFANATAGAIEAARNASDSMPWLGEALKAVANGATGGAAGLLGEVVDHFADAGEEAAKAAPEVDGAGEAIEDAGNKARRASRHVETFGQRLSGLVDDAFALEDAEAEVADAYDKLTERATDNGEARADAARRHADAVEDAARAIRDAETDLADAREDLNKQASGDRTEARRRLRDAEQRLADARADGAESIADATAEMDEWSPTLDEATRAGRENRDVIQEIVEGAAEVAGKMAEQGASAFEINRYLTTQRTELEKIGAQHGFNRTELEEYLTLLQNLANLAGPQTRQPGSADSLERQVQRGLLTSGGVVIENLNVTSLVDSADAVARSIMRELSLFGGRR